MTTRAGLATLVTGVLSMMAGRIFGIFELYIVGASMIALVACALVWVVINWRAISVRRQVHPARLHVGSVSTVTLTLTNERFVPTPVAQITDEVQGERRADAHVPPLRRNKSTRASYGIPAKSRGLVDIGPLQTRVTDPFGLASVVRRSATNDRMLVLPRIDPIPPPPQPGGDSAMRPDHSPGRVGPSGEEFSALRSYEVGDDLRKVHWASSARGEDLMIRTEHVPEYGRSIVLLDVRSTAADARTFECMVSAAASVLYACRSRGDTVRLVSTDGSELVADDARSFDRILDHLALIDQTEDHEPHLALSHAGAGAETAVLILGAASEGLMGALQRGAQHGRVTMAVRFTLDGARSTERADPLRSVRMIDVGGDDSFADRWARQVRRAVARAQ